MNKKQFSELTPELRDITKYILLGFSRNEIARKTNFSTSCVSNKLKRLFAIFQAKNKHEFIVNIFQQMIKTKQKEIDNKNIQIKNNNAKLKNLTMLLKNIIAFKENKDKLLIWINKSEVYLNK